MGQGVFDGLSVDAVQARFTGTFDVDNDDIKNIEMDRIQFFVVAVRVEGATLKVTETSDVKRVNILKVQDARLASGDVRDAAVEWLAGHHDPKLFEDKLGLAPADGPEFDGLLTTNGSRPEGVDENGAIEEVFVRDESDEIEVIEAPRPTNPRPSMPTDGPKVAKFRYDDIDPGSPADGGVVEIEQVGSVYAGPRGDTRLAKFMESGE